MKSETGKKIINEIVKETGLSYNVVYKIVLSQYGCLRQTIRESTPDVPETFKSVRHPYLGIFKVRLRVFKSMKGIKEYNKEQQRRKLLKYGNPDNR